MAKAAQLLGNFTTNLCEGWMHIRSKFDGGKQIQSGSWQNRCAGAGLRQNLGPAWGSQVWRDVTGTDENDVLLEVSSTLTNDSRKKKATAQAKETRKLRKSQLSRSDNTQQARRCYSRYDGGENADDVSMDLHSEFLQENMPQ